MDAQRSDPSLPGAQEGASAVIVAIALMVLFGFGAIAIDLGSAWETKRDLVADTDAAALAAAPYVLGTCSASALATATTVATEMMTANLGKAADTSRLDVRLDCNTSGLTVEYVEDAPLTLAPAVGTDQLPVLSSSTAAGDFQGGGLRPFSVCMKDPDVLAWLDGDGNNDGVKPDDPNVIHLEYAKSWDGAPDTDPNPCGGASGNWGFVCFDEDFGKSGVSSQPVDNPCGNTAVQEMVLSGYQGLVDLGDGSASNPPDCAPDTAPADPCDVKTGSLGGSIKNELDAIQCPYSIDAPDCPVQFPILGISEYTAGGSGSTATMEFTHFIGVVLRDFKTNPLELAYIDFELVAIFESGTSATATTGTLTTEPPVLCGVDHAPDQC